jgi:hypothetical protein
VHRTTSIRILKNLFVSTIAPHAGVKGNGYEQMDRLNTRGIRSGQIGVQGALHKRSGGFNANTSGISTDKILSADHWRSESTISKFYKREEIVPSIVSGVFWPPNDRFYVNKLKLL